MSLKGIGTWIADRLHVQSMFASTMGHHVPLSSASWWYVFGSATMVCLVLQLLTGICLAVVYVPAPDQAYQSLEYLNYKQPLGWFLRAIHFWGSNFMVGLMTIHMIQVFLFGAYKYPRELTWLMGCLLFLQSNSYLVLPLIAHTGTPHFFPKVTPGYYCGFRHVFVYKPHNLSS